MEIVPKSLSKEVEFSNIKYMETKLKRSIGIWISSIIAVVFGILTIKSGGSVLFGADIYREAAGNYVPFVVWFNFMAGFLYMITGIVIWMQKKIAFMMAAFIVIATSFVFVIFVIHILKGGDYELRTIMAMTLRTFIWLVITLYLSKVSLLLKKP